MLGGALSSLSLIPSKSLHHVVCNHPEPPFRIQTTKTAHQALARKRKKKNNTTLNDQITDNDNDNDNNETEDDSRRLQEQSGAGSHMLDSPLLVEVLRVLEPQGRLTITTDSKAYAYLLAQLISSVSTTEYRFEDAIEVEHNGYDGHDNDMNTGETMNDVARIQVHRGLPTKADTGLDAYQAQSQSQEGVASGTGSYSYFDRLWTQGDKTRRWYLHVSKVSNK